MVLPFGVMTRIRVTRQSSEILASPPAHVCFRNSPKSGGPLAASAAARISTYLFFFSTFAIEFSLLSLFGAPLSALAVRESTVNFPRPNDALRVLDDFSVTQVVLAPALLLDAPKDVVSGSHEGLAVDGHLVERPRTHDAASAPNGLMKSPV